MSGTQQGEMLNSGLDFFQDPGRAKHSVRHLQMCTDLHSLAVRAQDVKFWFSPRSKKHLHINVECWLSLSWILRNGWAICGRQQISRICVLVTNTFPLAGNQLPCNRNVNITDLIQMKLSQHWFLHSTFPTIFFAAFATPALLLTDSLPLQISNVDIKLQNIQEHKPCFWHTALFYITCCTSDHITSCQTSCIWNNSTWHKTFVT